MRSEEEMQNGHDVLLQDYKNILALAKTFPNSTTIKAMAYCTITAFCYALNHHPPCVETDNDRAMGTFLLI